MLKQLSSIRGCFIALNTLKITPSLFTLNCNFPFHTSINAPTVGNNGRLSKIGILLSSYISSMMKLIGKMNLPTFSRASSIIPLGCFSGRSANCSVIVVDLASPKRSFLKID